MTRKLLAGRLGTSNSKLFRQPLLGTLSIEDGECHGRSIDGKRGNLGTTLSPPAFVT